tara:strand:+ start:311 stop:484 length:174 start_codon:yes stop_codon:yes gene_type:complete
MAKKTYKVANPRDIPKGIPILSCGDQYWYEGDSFTLPTGMPKESVANWVRKGLLIND